MSPDPAFILTLALRMAVTAAFVVSASVITERAGPVIGALIATLPISAGPSYVFLALDHDAAFVAEGALASLPINAVTIFLGLTYVVLAQRRNAVVSFSGAVVVWIVLAALTRTVHWSLAGGLVANAVAFAICLPLLRRFRNVKMPLITRCWYDIPLRAAGLDAGGNRHDLVGLGRPQHQRHHRAVSRGVHQHDADPAPAHWRPGNRGRTRKQRMGPDGVWHRDCRAASRRTSVRLGGGPQSCADGLRELESRTVVAQPKTHRALIEFAVAAKGRKSRASVLLINVYN